MTDASPIPPSGESEFILKVENLTKTFGALAANDQVAFAVKKGHVHCLLGENGAGKSTLAKCIYGASKPDSGRILYKGKPVEFSSPRDAIRAGIGMVHQHFVLADPMNAVENIIVGDESAGGLLNLRAEKKKIQALCEQYGIALDLDTPAAQLSVGQQQWIEILKALYVGVELLLLDEPTAVLTPQEVESLFAIIAKMVQDGISVILITHKLHEVMSISHEVTVLRKGKVVDTLPTQGNTKASLARLLVGRDFDFAVHKEKVAFGPPVLEVAGLTVRRDNGSLALQDVSLTVRQGEVLGLAGVSGNGQAELFETLVGVRKAEKGSIRLAGVETLKDPVHNPETIANLGMASVPQDRLRQGLVGDFTVQENLVLGLHDNPSYSHGISMNWKAIKAFAAQAIQQFEIKTTGPLQPVHQLSGGNLQKVILAREVSRPIKVMVASSPSRGLDISATYYVYSRFIEMLRSGAGILMISEDLDEIFNVSDLIAVIYSGRIMGVFDVHAVDRETIGLYMAGLEEHEHS
ncbi:MAG: ABC transporter ATP-binding protein [Chloroflexi bacterium]|nr:ABC transporter ATP-binding protein [Chloroflexota bacterium]